jgi:hypothetical protein
MVLASEHTSGIVADTAADRFLFDLSDRTVGGKTVCRGVTQRGSHTRGCLEVLDNLAVSIPPSSIAVFVDVGANIGTTIVPEMRCGRSTASASRSWIASNRVRASRARITSPCSGCTTSTYRRRRSFDRSTGPRRSSASSAAVSASCSSPTSSGAPTATTSSTPSVAGCRARQAGGDELRQARPDRRIAAPAPDPGVLGQQAVLNAVEDELAQEQHVAPRPLPQQADADAVDRGAEHLLKQALHVGA